MPQVASLTPASGSIGTAVTISGADFGASQKNGSGSVTFNNTAAVVLSWSDTSILAEVPSGASTGNVVVTVVGQPSNSQNFSVTNGPSTCESNSTASAEFSGSYAYELSGFEGGGGAGTPFARIGSITIANGAITGGEEDLHIGASADVHHTVNAAAGSGTSFKVGPDNRGCMTLVFSDSDTVTFRLALGGLTSGVFTHGRIIEFDDASGTGAGYRASGLLLQQTPSAFAAAALGTNYAFGLEGFDATGGRVSESGTLTLAPATPTNNISNAYIDVNDAGNPLFGASGTNGASVGTLVTEPAGAISANGRTTENIVAEAGCAATCTWNYAVYVVNANRALVMSTDAVTANAPLVAGQAISTFSSFTAASWEAEATGFFGFLIQATGATSSGAIAELGQISFPPNSTSYQGTLNTYSAVANPKTTSTSVSGSFAVSSAGRLTFTSGDSNFVFYLTNPTVADTIAGFAVSTDTTTTAALGGQVLVEQSAAFSVSGNASYEFGSFNMGDNTVDNQIGVAAVIEGGNPLGSGDTINGAVDQSGESGLTSSVLNDLLFSFNNQGAITNTTDGSGNTIMGFADGDAMFFIDESGAAAVNVVQQ